MSVLNDVSVTDGACYRCIAMGVSASEVGYMLKIWMKMDGPRMDTIEYSVAKGDVPDDLVDVVNHYWKDEEGNYNWGLPACTWKELIANWISDRKNWRGGKWEPNLKRETTQIRARAMLAATYYLPVVKYDKHACVCTRRLILPALEKISSKVLYHGSKAIARIISGVAMGDEVGATISLLRRNIEKTSNFRGFSQYMSAMSVYTGTNVHDWKSAMARADAVDWDMAKEAEKYLSMAEFANACESVFRQTGGKGRLTKAAKKYEKRIKGAEHLKQPHQRAMAAGIIERANNAPIKALRTNGSSIAYRTRSAPGIRMIAGKYVVLARVGGEYFLLTREDLKSIRFCAMSHALWHVYAASLSVEYVDTEKQFGHIPGADVATAFNATIIALEARFAEVARERGVQKVVPLSVVKKNIGTIWAKYIQIMVTAIYIGRTDYLGRYLHELFEIYTAKLGGELMRTGYIESKAELIEEYTEMGFDTQMDVEDFEKVFAALPISAVQDFGRLSKIVYAYDVNPMYSYMDRVVKMNEPSPRGNARFVSDYTAEPDPLSEEDYDMSMKKFKCAARVMIAVSDSKTHILSQIDKDELHRTEGLPYHALVMRAVREGISLHAKVRYLAVGKYELPNRLRTQARRDASTFIRDGVMPTNPWAGNYLAVDDLYKYAERGDPDIGLLKASTVPDHRKAIVFSNMGGVARNTPTRDTNGARTKGRGTMIGDYLLGEFPSRREAILTVTQEVPIAAVSDKIETNKYPMKTRIIVGLCSAARRIQGEYEYNNGNYLGNVPGYQMGIDPNRRQKSIYSGLRDDTAEGYVRVMGSLDISGFSTGMHWDMQQATNEVLKDVYDGGADALNVLENCTKDAYMVRVDGGLRMFMKNSVGSNFEGVDGKRNTFMHCVLWYLARCEAYDAGLTKQMRAYLFIDDGSFVMDVEEEHVKEHVAIMRRCLLTTYMLYGFKLSLKKTVMSASYMQFLNELYLHGIHIGYGFRALCHTGAQTFPIAATVREEMAVIHGGIRGAAVSGGQSLRLLVGYNYIMHLYLMGVIGNKGQAARVGDPFVQALSLMLPTIAGGYGMPNWTGLFSNLSGNRDAEKHDRIQSIAAFCRVVAPDYWGNIRSYIKTNMLAMKLIKKDAVADRVTIAHPMTTQFGEKDRSEVICKYALEMATNREAIVLIKAYLGKKGAPGSFGEMVGEVLSRSPVALPMALVEKAVGNDELAAVVNLVEKIASSSMIERIVPWREIKRLNGSYRRSAYTHAKVIMHHITVGHSRMT